MSIHKSSRYLGKEILSVETSDGNRAQDYERIDTTAAKEDRAQSKVTRLPPGLRYTDVARKLLGNPRLWFKIAEYNPETFYILDAQGGDFLVVPPNRAASGRGVR